MKIDTLDFDSNQSPYDYICNVNLLENDKGNGTFQISITDHNYVAGCPIGTWKLLSGHITFNWGNSEAFFILQDPSGHQTRNIRSSVSKGTASGFNVEQLARSIFVTAQSIVAQYPSAAAYNAYMDFKKSLDKRHVKDYLSQTDSAACINSFRQNTLATLNQSLTCYRQLQEMLSSCKEPKASTLLVKATDELQQYLIDLYHKE